MTEERHVVQCYGADDRELIENVGRYLAHGLAQGEGILLVTIRAHTEAMVEAAIRNGADMAAALREGRAMLLDTQETLDLLMVDGQPDPERFEVVVGGAVRTLRRGAGVRVCGDMVGLLWKTWQFSAAIRLEELWNGFLAKERVSLFCAYPIDVFGLEFDHHMLHGLLCAHTHLLPTDEHLGPAVDRAIDEVLGAAAQKHRSLIESDARWAIMPAAEARVLWLRANLPDRADEILRRARRYTQESTAA